MSLPFFNQRIGVWASIKTSFSAALAINVSNGSGYFGSTYTANQAGGQWYADGVAISGATSQNFTMLSQYEGKAITYQTAAGTSNVITMFVPPNISGLVAWFDPSDQTTFTQSAGVVSQWNSKIGLISLQQPTTANRPTWSATGRNSKPAMLTSAASAQYFNLVNQASLPNGSNSGHMIILAYHNSTSTNAYQGLIHYGDQTNGRYYASKNNTNVVVNATGTTGVNTSASWLNSDHIVSSKFLSTGTQLELDGNGTASVSASINTANPGAFSSFFRSVSTEYWDGSAQEWVMFNRALTTTERNQIEGYLAAKWGVQVLLPSNHPYKSSFPTSIGGYLNIALTSGSGYFGSIYTANQSGGQWYADGSAISGATAQSYTMTVANEGKSITYVVGANTSNAIKMFVPSAMSGVVAWFDAADTTTITQTSGKVSQWASKVGTLTATQATSANQPTYSATGRNGLPAVSVVRASAQFMAMTNTTSLPTGTTNSHMLVTAYGSSANTGFGTIFHQGASTNNTSRMVLEVSSNAAISGYGTVADNPSSISWVNSDRMLAGAFNGGTASRIAIDGALTPTAKTGLSLNTTTQNANMFIDLAKTAANYWDGALQDFSIYSRELTDAERQKVEGYMAAKWGLQANLAAGHPYKTVAPTA